jgi:hypothetical protein
MNNNFAGPPGSVSPGTSFGALPRAHRPSDAAGNEFGGKVSAILARFPGPVTLHPSRIRYVGLLAASLGFVAALVFMLQHGSIGPGGALKAWLGIAFFGVGALIGAVMLLPGAGRLTLDADGFERVTLFMKFPASWQQASDFIVWEHRTGRGHRVRLVAYDDNCVGDNMSRRLSGRNAGLPDTYGLSPEELARLMTQWRGRALTRRR